MELLDAEKRVVEAGPLRTRLTLIQARGRSRFTPNPTGVGAFRTLFHIGEVPLYLV
jgi:hypothetical protein